MTAETPEIQCELIFFHGAGLKYVPRCITLLMEKLQEESAVNQSDLMRPNLPFNGKLVIASKRGAAHYLTDQFARETREQESYYTGYPYNYNNMSLLVNFCGVELNRKGSYVKRVCCDMFMTKIVLEGSMRLLAGRKQYLLHPGDLFFVRRNRDCEYTAGPSGFYRKIGVTISGTLLDAILTSLNLEELDVLNLSDPAPVISLMRKAMEVLKERPPDYLLRSSVIAFELLVRLGNERSNAGCEPEILRAQDFLRRNVSRALRAKEIAVAAGCGIVRLNAMFRHHFGTTPVAYHVRERLREAETLLLDTNCSIKEIASKVGYSSAIYFSNDFRKHLSCSPRAYRNAGNRDALKTGGTRLRSRPGSQ